MIAAILQAVAEIVARILDFGTDTDRR